MAVHEFTCIMNQVCFEVNPPHALYPSPGTYISKHMMMYNIYMQLRGSTRGIPNVIHDCYQVIHIIIHKL